MSNGWEKPGDKTHSLIIKPKTKEQAYCQTHVNNETSLMLCDRMNDEVSDEMRERGVNQGGLFTGDA